jgi:ATP phosphoribosyltransferase
MKRIKIAVQKKGRLSEQSISLLKKCGISFSQTNNKLIIRSTSMPVDILLVRDDDIPNLINQGIADIGIVGNNVLEEQESSGKCDSLIKEVMLGFSKCRLSLAAPKTKSFSDLNGLTIATSYPGILGKYLNENNIKANIVEIHGSVELTPFIGIADLICDLVSTGATLESNNLEEINTIIQSEAVLVTNSNTNNVELVKKLISRVVSVTDARNRKYIMFNADNQNKEELINMLPAAESPTVIPLADTNKIAIHALCKENIFWETIDNLKEKGASSIVILPVEKLVS